MTDVIAPFIARREEHIRKIEALVPENEKQVRCPKHGGLLALDPWRSSEKDGKLKLEYMPCEDCAEEIMNARKESQCIKELKRRGIPLKLFNACLDQLTYNSPDDQAALEKCRQFSIEPKGFLTLLGGAGSGKSHIAAGILILTGHGRFVTHNEALGELRESYRQRWDYDDPIDPFKKVSLLVLDELGVTTGGRDDATMLHEIIDYRYSNFLPTIITSNMDLDTFREFLGERIVDRIREAQFLTHSFTEPSHRKESNSTYLAQATRYRNVQKLGM